MKLSFTLRDGVSEWAAAIIKPLPLPRKAISDAPPRTVKHFPPEENLSDCDSEISSYPSARSRARRVSTVWYAVGDADIKSNNFSFIFMSFLWWYFAPVIIIYGYILQL